MREIRPQLIVNAAAYTAVDAAESDESNAYAINAGAPALLAEEAKRFGALLVHYSSDYVFDGSKRSPYNESDETSPLNVYGRTKLIGDEALAIRALLT
jgi:dTDP-4-dehydrorhamnose reductase